MHTFSTLYEYEYMNVKMNISLAGSKKCLITVEIFFYCQIVCIHFNLIRRLRIRAIIKTRVNFKSGSSRKMNFTEVCQNKHYIFLIITTSNIVRIT